MTRGVCGGLSSKFAGFDVHARQRGVGPEVRRRRVRHRRAVRAVAAGALSAALLVGCSPAAPVPTTPPTTTAPPSPTPSPTDVAIAAPERPAEMERSDEVGAVAAAEYFMRLQQYVLLSGDLSDWESVTAQACGSCDRFSQDVDRVYSAGGRYVGGERTLGDVTVLNQDPTTGGYAVGVEYTAEPCSELDAADNVVHSFPGATEYGIVDEVYSAQGWVLVGYVVQEQRES